jgi:hypothetical protein
MNALEARVLLFQRKLREMLVEESLPDLSELDGQLSMLELKAGDLQHANKLAEGPDGTADEILLTAAMVCKSLVMRDTKERLFSDNDMGSIDYSTGTSSGVASFGMTIIKPLSDLVAQVCGLTPDALLAAKKNSPTIPVSASATSLPVNSEAAPVAS